MSVNVTYGLRSVKVKTTPSQNLNDVLVRACESFKLDPSRFDLKHKTKLDLSLPFRLSGLTAGAKVDLVPRTTVLGDVSIKLQLQYPPSAQQTVDAAQLVKKFPGSTRIEDVLRRYEAELQVPIIVVTDATGGFEPSLQTMSRTIQKAEFGQTLLAMGITGASSIRVSFRRTVSLEEQRAALQKHSQEQEAINVRQQNVQAEYLKKKREVEELREVEERRLREVEERRLKEVEEKEVSDEQKTRGVLEEGRGAGVKGVDEANTSATSQKAEKSTSQPIDVNIDANSMEVDTPEKLLGPIIFKPSPTPLQIYDHPEAAYDMTVSQAKKYQALIALKAHPVPAKLRQRPVAKAFAECDIRVKFPDGDTLQVSLKPTQPLVDLFHAVNQLLINPRLEYKLCLSFPHTELKDLVFVSLLEAGFGPRTMVRFEVDVLQKGPFLKETGHEVPVTVMGIQEADDVKLEAQRSQMVDEVEMKESSISGGKLGKTNGVSGGKTGVAKFLRLGK
ncbi:hypothetical protein BABINDRAFT_86485 [Babjeviella inositovora NRRL Y-12698]|uniref:UBX domain-containing protein n=1 Tax=Babjeviella inositovora NRRL Y-12698 TaxID=984486 RepID=A0A1E3QM77_9ASCO|nr:uncharacterized protein BABINDRAFT_86485 [Babjeviella inositovora NRRL Y-12698]ODQ78564.1 hypothetical protein BABINDRAFT_86485 [Babjeviella inositovora NRRL Y-12698]